MKIRTDFVTNSSSESTAEIVIDNPMLLEILQRYKNLGAFGDHTLFGIGEFVSESEVSNIKKPAFHYSEELHGDGWASVFSSPKTLAEVLGEIITIIGNSSQFNKELIAQMKEELQQKEAEIENNYAMVYWSSIQEGEDEPEVIGGKFTYDQENGEKYIGYGSTEVMIDNPILLEILQKYKDLGTFYTDPGFSIGNYPRKAEISRPSSDVILMTPDLYGGTGEDEDSYRKIDPPTSLNDVVNSILDSLVVSEETEAEDLFEKMKTEMTERRDEIMGAYKFVDWKSRELLREDFFYKDSYDGYVDESSEFVYSPLNGEDFHYIRKAGPGWDEKVEEGFIYGEKHIVNGKVLVDFGSEYEGEEEGEKDEESYE